MTDKTITRAELARIIADNTGPDEIAPGLDFMATVVAAAGITIAEPDPPEAMGDKADSICDIAFPDGWNNDRAKVVARLRHEAELRRHLADCDPSDLGKEADAVVAERKLADAILQEQNDER